MITTLRKTTGGKNRNTIILITLFLSALLFMFDGLSTLQAANEASAPTAKTAGQTEAANHVVAIVNGQPIKEFELEKHSLVTKLSRDDALEDLIDLCLLRTAAGTNGLITPKEPWSDKARADIEFALAKALTVDIPPLRVTLIVDHAWLKDADDSKGRTAGRTLMERLRKLVEAGATIPKAYDQLRVKGTPWHIGDNEEYEYDVIPIEAHDLPPGSLSPIIPGDGGLHLFKILQRKQELPPRDDIRVPLFARLRIDATIERSESPSP